MQQLLSRSLGHWRHDAISIAGRMYWREDLLQLGDQAQQVLGDAYAHKAKCACLCQGPENPIPMHIVHRDGLHILRRNPNSGPAHHSRCQSNGDAVAGMRDLYGKGAIKEGGSGVSVALEQALSEGEPVARDPQVARATAQSQVKREVVSQHGLLAWLWLESELNTWVPGMDGKRWWGVVRKLLLNVLSQTQFGRSLASSYVFVPPPMVGATDQERRDMALRTEKSFRAHYHALYRHTKAGRSPIAMIVAPFGGIYSDEGAGRWLELTHMRRVRLHDSRALLARFERVNAGALARIEEDGGRSRLMCVAAVALEENGDYGLRSLASMEVLEKSYLPVDNSEEVELISALISRKSSLWWSSLFGHINRLLSCRFMLESIG